MLKFKPNKLDLLMRETFLGLGLNDVSTDHAVTSMMQTSLRGVDSHGINLFPHYCRAISSGRINSNPAMKFNDSGVSAVSLDADHAIGHHAGAAAIDYSIKRAKDTGICAVNVRNSTHFGAAAYFALRAAEDNCIGFAFTNADALVKATNARDAFFGTNPICVAAPMLTEGPLCHDMATSIVSWNKIKNYRREDASIPVGWAYDENGKSVTDPHKARTLAPTGEYKGYGLGLIIDIFCAILARNPIGKDMLPMYTSPIEAKRCVSHFFMALDIEKFLPADEFKQILQSMVDRIRAMDHLDANKPVMVPADPEKKMARIREIEGIPVYRDVLDEFCQVHPGFKEVLV